MVNEFLTKNEIHNIHNLIYIVVGMLGILVIITVLFILGIISFTLISDKIFQINIEDVCSVYQSEVNNGGIKEIICFTRT